MQKSADRTAKITNLAAVGFTLEPRTGDRPEALDTSVPTFPSYSGCWQRWRSFSSQAFEYTVFLPRHLCNGLKIEFEFGPTWLCRGFRSDALRGTWNTDPPAVVFLAFRRRAPMPHNGRQARDRRSQNFVHLVCRWTLERTWMREHVVNGRNFLGAESQANSFAVLLAGDLGHFSLFFSLFYVPKLHQGLGQICTPPKHHWLPVL